MTNEASSSMITGLFTITSNIPIIFMLIGIVVQTYSAYIFAKTWLMPDEQINNLAGTYWDSNPHFLDFLRTTRSITYKGIFFLVVGMIFLVISAVITI